MRKGVIFYAKSLARGATLFSQSGEPPQASVALSVAKSPSATKENGDIFLGNKRRAYRSTGSEVPEKAPKILFYP